MFTENKPTKISVDTEDTQTLNQSIESNSEELSEEQIIADLQAQLAEAKAAASSAVEELNPQETEQAEQAKSFLNSLLNKPKKLAVLGAALATLGLGGYGVSQLGSKSPEAIPTPTVENNENVDYFSQFNQGYDMVNLKGGIISNTYSYIKSKSLGTGSNPAIQAFEDGSAIELFNSKYPGIINDVTNGDGSLTQLTLNDLDQRMENAAAAKDWDAIYAIALEYATVDQIREMPQSVFYKKYFEQK